MTRSDALAPLNKGEGSFNLTAGVGIRGEIRRGAIRYGVDFYEEKGWLESIFVFRGPADQLRQFYNALKNYVNS